MAEETRREEYEAKTVPQLKQLLRDRDLKVSGNKSDLIQRLLGDDAAAEAQAEPEVVELTAAEISDMAEAAELAERNLGAEPEAAEPAERPCETCGEPFTPAKPEHKHCPKCFQAYRRRGAREQVEKALKQVHGILSRIIERNTPSTGGAPWYDFTEAISLYERAKDRYAAGDYRNLVGDLYQGVLGKANEITANGDTGYVTRLIESGELEETPELQKLQVEVDSLLAEKKFREAAAKAQELKQLAGRLRREQGEAKKQELLESLSFDLPAMKRRYQGAKKGSERGGSGDPRKPRHDRYVRDRRGTRDFLAEVEEEYGEGSVAAQLAARELGRKGR